MLGFCVVWQHYTLVSELGGMPDAKAPNDQEVLFESVALLFFFFPLLSATAARATASQKVELSDGMYFVEEKRSMPIQLTLTLHVVFCHYGFVIQLKDHCWCQ